MTDKVVILLVVVLIFIGGYKLGKHDQYEDMVRIKVYDCSVVVSSKSSMSIDMLNVEGAKHEYGVCFVDTSDYLLRLHNEEKKP